jgi:hypothetical protein
MPARPRQSGHENGLAHAVGRLPMHQHTSRTDPALARAAPRSRTRASAMPDLDMGRCQRSAP